MGDDCKGTSVRETPDVYYLELRCQELEEEISHPAHEAIIQNLKLRKLNLEDELRYRQQFLKLERQHYGSEGSFARICRLGCKRVVHIQGTPVGS